MPAGRTRASWGAAQGFTLVAMLVLLAVTMLGLSIAGPLWSRELRREREQELIRTGQLYAQALRNYRDGAPGSLKQYPQTLGELLADSRFVGLRRHLRKLYPDPMNPGQPWGLMLDKDQRIVGVYSLSELKPIAEAPLALDNGLTLASAQRYSDWKFTLEANP